MLPVRRSLFLALTLMLVPAWGHAATVRQFTPQGEVRDAEQATAVFNTEMVPLGSVDSVQPFEVQCPVSGKGAWNDPRTWTYRFSRALEPGEQCVFQLKKGLKAINGEVVSGKQTFNIVTPGPWILEMQPDEDTDRIEDDQVFLITPRAPVDRQSLEQHAWCETDGVGERLPLKVLPDGELQKILQALHQQARPGMLAAQCKNRLPPGAKMQLVWGKGIRGVRGGVVTLEERFKHRVNEPFRASFSCERETPSSPCSPLSDLRLQFNADVPWKDAGAIRLVVNGKALSPWRDKHATEDTVGEVVFKGPFGAQLAGQIKVPASLKDLAGRPLTNLSSFPLNIGTGALPPLAKFAAPFGILEAREGGVLPVTVRNVEASINLKVARFETLQDVIDVQGNLHRFEQKTRKIMLPRKPSPEDEDQSTEIEVTDWMYPRELSFLQDYVEAGGSQPGAISALPKQKANVAASYTLPKPSGSQPFEVMGVPLTKPGFYVVELESQLLGKSLLLQKNLKNPKPMYVRATALVTDLSVHFKKGRENSLVWVTRLSTGKPVADAEVEIADCNGRSLWSGKTDAQGRALAEVDTKGNVRCNQGNYAYFASARLGDDYSFVQSDWTRGIEPWRFNVNTWRAAQAEVVHAVLDRTLLRAGETLSMKLVGRHQKLLGFDYPGSLPSEVKISLIGGEFEETLPVSWDERGIATVQWKIPTTAALGSYAIAFPDRWESLGTFRVSDFRLPAYTGAIHADATRLGGVSEIPLNLNLAYLNGGGAGGQEVQVSSLMEQTTLNFPAYGEFNFGLPRERVEKQLLADKRAVKLDKTGGSKTVLKLNAPLTAPMRLTNEMTFSDPSGEVQTIAGEVELWPASIAVGLHLSDDRSVDGKRIVRALVVGLDGKPKPGVTVSVTAQRKLQYTHRKRIVGGFYSYETEDKRENLGQVCHDKTDARGIMRCEVAAEDAGTIELTADVQDRDGRHAQAGSSFWSSGDGEVDAWFAQGDQDRMELTPFKREYQPGEKIQLQVHTPFREATALIAVEREGVIETMVQPLYRHDAVVEIPVKPEWTPNVFVSVLAVRGRLHEVPWYSFFQWGWKAPRDWWKEWRKVPQPTAMVDLARPSYKFGLTELKIGRAGYTLDVQVSADKATYGPREVAKVRVKVLQPNGKPAPQGSEVVVAAVDKALLELSPNPSWNLLDAMLQEHAYQIETATGQMQVVGKRHYGKKALPAGGGGGHESARELFDTLLYWNPRVKLDAQGEALVNVPLNDSLTAFKLVAVADVGTSLFGTGETEIASTQPLQLISGLPPLVRENDRYRAAITVRNGTDKPVQVTLNGHAGGQALAPQTIRLEANAAREVAWLMQAPREATTLEWLVEAKSDALKDRIKLSQKVIAAVPVEVQQANFIQLDQAYKVPAELPKGAIPGKGGIDVQLSASLASQTQGIVDYFNAYPYSCLEQKTSIAVGLMDKSRWESIVAELPNYLDGDGFAMYFSGPWRGSDSLTAYVLTVAPAAGFEIPADARARMESALAGFVEGRLKPDYWVPDDRLIDRRIHALEALARTGKAEPRMLGAFDVKPIATPTATLMDWYSILLRVNDAPERDARLAEVQQELRNRLQYVGSGRLLFSTEAQDNWWWMMGNGDVNSVRMIDIAMHDPAMKEELPALLRGALLRQNKGRWTTTVANAWGRVALEEFARAFEAEPVQGTTKAALGESLGSYGWKAEQKTETGSVRLKWPAKPAELRLTHEGSGKPWVTMLVKAAVPYQTVSRGFSVTRSVTAVEQKVPGTWSKGDVMRVRLTIKSAQELSWVAVSDPTPGGASILGNTARDSTIARTDENKDVWKDNAALPAFTERGFGFFRAYYDYVPKGQFWLEYTVRLNNAGQFSLPATRVEAMYAPEVFGELPNASMSIEQK